MSRSMDRGNGARSRGKGVICHGFGASARPYSKDLVGDSQHRRTAGRTDHRAQSRRGRRGRSTFGRSVAAQRLDQRRELPSLRGLKREVAELNRQVATVSLEQLDLGERWRQLGNAEALIEELTGELDEQRL